MDPTTEDFIKKSKVQYLRCTKSGTHQGQLLTLVCVEQKCPNRGLVCPVCRQEQHDQHKIVPLKIFLQEANNRFACQTNQHELTSLSDYLRQLENSRRELLKQLSTVVDTLTAKIKEIEEKISQSYSVLRKMTLTESTISNKLPRVIRMMIDGSTTQQNTHLMEEFQKYALLARYKQNSIEFEENSKRNVQQYSQRSSLVKEYLKTNLPNILKLLDDIPFIYDATKSDQQLSKIKYTFSKTLKHNEIQVSADEKEAHLIQTYDDEDSSVDRGGFVFVKEGLGAKNQSIEFKIQNVFVGLITFGMANSQTLKANSFQMIADDSESHGIYGISSDGFPIKGNNSSVEEETSCFTLQVNDTLHIESNAQERKITFTKKKTSEKHVMTIPTEVDLTKMQFVVGLFSKDTVKIVD